MRVLLVGGSGYLGRRTAELLVERGDEVVVMSRGRLQPDVLANVRTITVDRTDRPAFESAFRDARFDAVIDNIAYTAEDIQSAVRAFEGRIGHYVFTSTMAVYHETESLTPLREDTADLTYVPPEGAGNRNAFHPTQGHAYGIGKRRAEMALQQQQAFAFTSIRPPIVVSADDRTRRVWWFVQRIMDGGPIVLIDWGPGRIFQVVFADDLARALVNAAGNERAFGKAYNIAQPEIFDAETWVAALATPLGRQAETARVPEPLLDQVGLGEYVLPIAGRPFGNYIVDISAARADLDFVPTPFPRWTDATARGCAESPPPGDSAGYEHRQREVAVARVFADARQQALLSAVERAQPSAPSAT